MSGKHVGIDLLRHGDTGQRSYRGQLDDPLSPLGWTQLRGAIFGRTWGAIVTSPLLRCSEFAHELGSARRIAVRIDPRLAEYHFGDWQGVPIEALARDQADALGRFWSDPVAYPPPGAESFAAFRERLSGALHDVAAEAVSQRVLVVTHGGVIRLLRCEAEGRDLADMAGIEVPHASLHSLEWATTAGG